VRDIVGHENGKIDENGKNKIVLIIICDDDDEEGKP
jgi:hypothetical protein